MADKIRIHPILDEIQKEYSQYLQILKPFEEKINQNSETKHIIAFANIMMCYGEEAAFLYNHGWCNSIEPLARDFLECYVIIKNLIKFYPNNADYKDYIRYLYYLDINQTITIIRATEKDSTYSTTEQQEIISTKLENIKFVIREFFDEYIADINEGDLKSSILSIFKNIQRNYYKGRFDKPKTKNIEVALLDNQAWIEDAGVPYKGAGVIYGELCHSTHNNIISVIKRTINNKYFMMNTETENVVPALSLVCYCMKDVNLRVKHFYNNL